MRLHLYSMDAVLATINEKSVPAIKGEEKCREGDYGERQRRRKKRQKSMLVVVVVGKEREFSPFGREELIVTEWSIWILMEYHWRCWCCSLL